MFDENMKTLRYYTRDENTRCEERSRGVERGGRNKIKGDEVHLRGRKAKHAVGRGPTRERRQTNRARGSEQIDIF